MREILLDQPICECLSVCGVPLCIFTYILNKIDTPETGVALMKALHVTRDAADDINRTHQSLLVIADLSPRLLCSPSSPL